MRIYGQELSRCFPDMRLKRYFRHVAQNFQNKSVAYRQFCSYFVASQECVSTLEVPAMKKRGELRRIMGYLAAVAVVSVIAQISFLLDNRSVVFAGAVIEGQTHLGAATSLLSFREPRISLEECDGVMFVKGLRSSRDPLCRSSFSTDLVDAEDGIIDGNRRYGSKVCRGRACSNDDWSITLASNSVGGQLPSHVGVVETDRFTSSLPKDDYFVDFPWIDADGGAIRSRGILDPGDEEYDGETADDDITNMIHEAGIRGFEVSSRGSMRFIEVDHLQRRSQPIQETLSPKILDVVPSVLVAAEGKTATCYRGSEFQSERNHPSKPRRIDCKHTARISNERAYCSILECYKRY